MNKKLAKLLISVSVCLVVGVSLVLAQSKPIYKSSGIQAKTGTIISDKIVANSVAVLPNMLVDDLSVAYTAKPAQTKATGNASTNSNAAGNVNKNFNLGINGKITATEFCDSAGNNCWTVDEILAQIAKLTPYSTCP